MEPRRRKGENREQGKGRERRQGVRHGLWKKRRENKEEGVGR